MKVNKQLYFLVVSSIFVLILGSLGFYYHRPDTDPLTAIYLALQLFSMNSGVVDAPTPLLIEISRWLALGTLVGAVYATISTLLVHFKSTSRIARFKDHAIVCGAGKRGEALVRAFQKTGTSNIVVIELDENTPSLGELRNLGVEVVIGNAIDAAVLQKAGIARAKALVAVTGDDERNLSICSEVYSELNTACELSAGLESWSWRTYSLDRMKSKIRLDSYLSRATRSVILDIASEAVKVAKFRNEGFRFLLEVSDVNRQEFLRAAIMILQISGDKKPLIELTCVGAGQEQSFRDRFPAVDLVADLRWHEGTASQVFPEGSGQTPDFAVFALSNDIETLEAAERFLMRHAIAHDRIVACLHEDSNVTNANVFQRKEKDFSVIRLMDQGLGLEDPLEPKNERRAQICHAIYFMNEKAKNPTYGMNPGDEPESWIDLKERTKESNRLAAMHHQIKKNAWHSREPNSAMEILNHLSRCEHMRWMAEKAMDGWRWSGSLDKASRDNTKLKHHLLIPYDALDNPEKEKDYNVFLWALDMSDADLEHIDISEESKRMVQIARSIAVG
jgi:hypothetical protein